MKRLIAFVAVLMVFAVSTVPVFAIDYANDGKKALLVEIKKPTVLPTGLTEDEVDSWLDGCSVQIEYPNGTVQSASVFGGEALFNSIRTQYLEDGTSLLNLRITFVQRTVSVSLEEKETFDEVNLYSFSKSVTYDTGLGTGIEKLDLEISTSLSEAGQRTELLKYIELLGSATDTGSTLINRINTMVLSMSGYANLGGDYIANADTLFNGENTDNIIQRAYNVIYPICTVLMVLIWVIGIGKSAISTDLFTGEKMVKPIIRIIWGIGLMAISMTLLELIFGIAHGLLQSIHRDTNISPHLLTDWIEESEKLIDKTWVIGPIMTFFNVLVSAPRLIAYMAIESLFAIVLQVVLYLRFIRLAVMQAISPMFFAFSVSEKTERYTQSFIKEYIVLCIQAVVAAIMYAVVMGEFFNYSENLVLRLILSIAGMIAVAGSGKFISKAFGS